MNKNHFNCKKEIKALSRYSLILLFVTLGFPSFSLSHSGELDSYGCHHNRKKGGYHCHQGQFAGKSFSTKAEMLREMEKNKNPKKSD